MKRLMQSTFMLFAIGLLLILNVFNSCQLNNLERQVIEQGQKIDELSRSGVRVAAGGAAPSAGASSDAAALADPDNLLVDPGRARVNADGIVRGGTLRQTVGSDPRGLNPYIANGADVSMYATFMNDHLASRKNDDPDAWIPELAVKVTTPDDGLTYRITLREGVYWHAPTVEWESGQYEWLRGDHELTSDDYAFVFEMLQNPQVSGRVSSLRTYFESLESFRVIDRYTFEVKYSEKLFTNLPNLLDLSPAPRWLYMYDEDGVAFDESTWGLKVNEHWYNQKGIGVGPYRFVAWEPGVKLELERNEGYWGEAPSFDRIVYLILKDQNAWPRKVKTGELDIAYFQPEQYRTEVLQGGEPYLGHEDVKLAMQPTLGYFYIGWNQDTPYFGDKRVRQAMTLALNRFGIVDNVFHGLGDVTSGPFAQQMKCYDDSIDPWPFDLERARALLDEAGWRDLNGDGIREKEIDGELVTFEFNMLIYGSSTEFETLSNIYREDLLSVGVKLNPRAVEWSTMLKKMDEREFDAYTGAWVMDWEVDLYQLWHSSEADRPDSSNRIGFRNAEADEIAVELRRTLDTDRRVELCHQFHALVHEEQPYTFIYQRKRPNLYWDYLSEPEFSLNWPYRDVRLWGYREARP